VEFLNYRQQEKLVNAALMRKQEMERKKEEEARRKKEEEEAKRKREQEERKIREQEEKRKQSLVSFSFVFATN